jgi:dipeptidyl aminopeptidase/acylaminoacyl peptidase
VYRCFTVVLFMCVIIASLVVARTNAQTPVTDITTDTSQSTPAILPVKAFTKYDEFGGIKLSPSGKYAAFMSGKYGRSLIVFMTMKDKKAISSVYCHEDFEFDDFHWISDRRIVYRLAERQFTGVVSGTGELFAIDVDGKKQEFIYGYRSGQKQTGTLVKVRQSKYATAELINPLLNDKKRILISEMPWEKRGNVYYYDPDAKPIVSLLNVYTGRKKKVDVAPLSDATVITDQQDRVRFALGLNSEFQYTASWKPDPDGEWADFDLPGFREDSIVPIIMSEDAQSVYFLGTESDSLYSALFCMDLQTKGITKIFGLEDRDISDLIFDLKGKRIIGVVTYTDKPVTHWLDKKDKSAQIRMSLIRTFSPQTVRILTTTKDGSLSVFLVNSDTNPGDFYLLDTKTKKADYLQPARAWINPEEMRPKQPFTFKARDGLTLHGYITRPKGTGPYPMVVLPHGGPHGMRDSWEFDPEVQLFANRGYAVLQVNYRGSGGFGEVFEHLGYRQWGGKIQDDITDATLWAIDQEITTRDRVCIYGNSFGAYAALEGVVREPTLYRCAIGYAGIYDLELMFSTADMSRSKTGKSYLRRVLGSDTDLLRAWSPVYKADRIQVPVLLIHGKEDWRADFKQAKRMKSALEKKNKKFEWMALSKEGHGVHDEQTRTEVYERIVEFLDKYVKASTATSATIDYRK